MTPEDFRQAFHDLPHFLLDSPYDRNFKGCRRTHHSLAGPRVPPGGHSLAKRQLFGRSAGSARLLQYDAQCSLARIPAARISMRNGKQ